jgi:hypothetical protein
MDVDGSMVIAVEEKRVAVFFENLRHYLSVHDRGLGAPLRRGLIAQRVPGSRVRLPRPFAEHRSGTPCDLLRDDADWGLSRFLSRFLADTHFFPTNPAVVTNPTRGVSPARHRPIPQPRYGLLLVRPTSVVHRRGLVHHPAYLSDTLFAATRKPMSGLAVWIAF